MRRIVAMGCLVSLVSSMATAANQTYSGCGLGYLLLSHDSNSRFIQLLGVTTNGTFGSQTFGITSGTSGCNQDGSLARGRQVEAYVEVNFESLRREMANGQGEFVEDFAALLEANAASRPALVKLFQTNYAMLFASPRTTPQEMLQTLAMLLPKSQTIAPVEKS